MISGMEHVVPNMSRLAGTFTLLASNWKVDESDAGPGELIHALEQLERFIIDNQAEAEGGRLAELAPILEELLSLVKIKDLFAVADIVQYRLCPVIRNWETEGIEHHEGTDR